jgi:hypothetical protein
MKQLTARELREFLNQIEREGANLGRVQVYFRTDDDSDVELVTIVEEDLFDAETNNKLTSIILKTK